MDHPAKGLQKQLILFAAVVIGVILIVGAYIFGIQQAKQTVGEPTATPSVVPTASATPSPSPTPSAIVPVTDDGVTWLGEPEKITKDLKLFKTTVKGEKIEGYNPVITYYRTGSDNGQDIILALVAPEGPGGDTEIVFVKTGDTTYDFLAKMSPEAFDDQGMYYPLDLADKVKTNTTKIYKSISLQRELSLKGIKIVARGRGSDPTFLSDYKTDNNKDIETTSLTEAGITPYGTVYRYVRSQAKPRTSTVDSVTYLLKRPDGTAESYLYAPSWMKDDSVAQVTWNDTATNNDAYRYDGTSGCGSPNFISVMTNGNLNDLQAIGKASGGEIVYQFKDTNHPVFQYYWKVTEGKYYDSAKSDYVSITIDEFQAKHGLFVYKSPLGDYMTFSSLKYGPQAECGKPVIYLYPQKATDVSVKVDAKITKSEPAYGSGWQVTAQPNGLLTTLQGAHYDSLFWEGTGHEYPTITEGFVVAQKDLVPTIQKHLSQLGLNSKESKEFMEFWQAKLPTTPYVRLTWFGTRQMDRLAPLTISPKPDTVIRIFLDFEGLQQPAKIAPQRLSSIPRKGFTLVEWGGLLRK